MVSRSDRSHFFSVCYSTLTKKKNTENSQKPTARSLEQWVTEMGARGCRFSHVFIGQRQQGALQKRVFFSSLWHPLLMGSVSSPSILSSQIGSKVCNVYAQMSITLRDAYCYLKRWMLFAISLHTGLQPDKEKATIIHSHILLRVSIQERIQAVFQHVFCKQLLLQINEYRLSHYVSLWNTFYGQSEGQTKLKLQSGYFKTWHLANNTMPAVQPCLRPLFWKHKWYNRVWRTTFIGMWEHNHNNTDGRAVCMGWIATVERWCNPQWNTGMIQQRAKQCNAPETDLNSLGIHFIQCETGTVPAELCPKRYHSTV